MVVTPTWLHVQVAYVDLSHVVSTARRASSLLPAAFRARHTYIVAWLALNMLIAMLILRRFNLQQVKLDDASLSPEEVQNLVHDALFQQFNPAAAAAAAAAMTSAYADVIALAAKRQRA